MDKFVWYVIDLIRYILLYSLCLLIHINTSFKDQNYSTSILLLIIANISIASVNVAMVINKNINKDIDRKPTTEKTRDIADIITAICIVSFCLLAIPFGRSNDFSTSKFAFSFCILFFVVVVLYSVLFIYKEIGKKEGIDGFVILLWLIRSTVCILLMITTGYVSVNSFHSDLLDPGTWLGLVNIMSLSLLIMSVAIWIVVALHNWKPTDSIVGIILDTLFGTYGTNGVIAIAIGLMSGDINRSSSVAITTIGLLGTLGGIIVLSCKEQSLHNSDLTQSAINTTSLLANSGNFLASFIGLIIIIHNQSFLSNFGLEITVIANTAGVFIVWVSIIDSRYKYHLGHWGENFKSAILGIQGLGVLLVIVTELAKVAGAPSGELNKIIIVTTAILSLSVFLEIIRQIIKGRKAYARWQEYSKQKKPLISEPGDILTFAKIFYLSFKSQDYYFQEDDRGQALQDMPQ